jgi:hypothetical protein
MTSIYPTSIVYNNPNKLLNFPAFYYRCKGFCPNLNGNTPSEQYQRQKLIQNTVRVYSSLYTSNIGPLNAYKKPTIATYGVCWNQMSDRTIPSIQKNTVPTGFYNSLNNRRYSVTSSKPGSQTPGGIGCDIKHNSYDRYLNRLKGKGPLRRGIIPPTFGAPIPFNPAFPIYGGKTIKTNIVTGCNCPIVPDINNLKENSKLYDNPVSNMNENNYYKFSVGEYVYAKEIKNTYYTRAKIKYIENGMYIIEFDNGKIQTVNNETELLVYSPCNCNGLIDDKINKNGFFVDTNPIYGNECNINSTSLETL